MSLLDNLRAQAPALRNVDDETLKQTLRVQPEFRAYSDEQFEALVTGTPSASTEGRNSETMTGFAGDLVDAAQMGAYNVAQGLGDFSYEYTGVGRGLGDFGREGAASQLEQMSPRAAEAIQQQIFESTGSGLWDFKPGEGFNPLTIALQTASLAGEAVASGGLAGGGSRVGLSLTGKVIGRTARRNAARQGLDEAGQQAAAVQAMRDFASSRTADGVKLGTYGAVETAVNTGQIADGAYQEILAMPDEELDQSQAFAETYWQLADENPNASVDELRQQAREQLGQGAKSLVMRDPALLLTTGVLGGYGGKVLDDLVTKGTKAGSGRLGAAIRQAGVQGTIETGQGGMGQYSINTAVADIGADPTRDPMEGVAAAGLSEGLIGGVMGGGMGAVAGRPQPAPQADPAAEAARAREEAAAQGADPLGQTQAAQQAEQRAQSEQQAAEQSPEAQAQRQQQASEVGLRIQRGMTDADDLQNLARGSSFEGGTRLRNMRMIVERAETALEAGNIEQAASLMARAEAIGADLATALRTTGTRERPMEGELADPEAPQGDAPRLEGRRGQLPPGTGDSIAGESPSQFDARQRTQQEQADTLSRRNIGRDDVIYGEGPTRDPATEQQRRRAAFEQQYGTAQNTGLDGEYLGPDALPGRPNRQGETLDGEIFRRPERLRQDTAPRIPQSGIIYGDGPTAGNANTGLDQPFERARFTDTGARNAMEGQRAQQQASAERAAQLARTRGRGQTTYLPDNTPIRTRFRVVEASELTTSNSPDGRVNQRYPQELQPRDRTNANSQVQVRNIAARLNPERLGSSNDAGTGAPIIGSDGVVESGNGRTMAITTAYSQNSPQAQRYREFVRAEAERQGIDPSAVDEMQQPVLVRERITNVDRADFARRANESQVAGMTAYEQAQADADSLTADDLQEWQPDESGDPLAASNRSFQRGFVQRLGNNEASRYTTRDGQATPELGQRMQRAVFAAAYQDADMVEMVTENSDQMRNLAAGLQAAAADLAVARETGSRDALDAIGTINDAVRLVRRSRQDGISVRELTRQTDAFTDAVTETTALLAVAINNSMRSRQAMTTAFRYIGSAVRNRAEGEANGALFADDTTNGDIFNAGFQGQNQNQRTQQRPPERDVQPGADGREQGAERQGQAEPAQRPQAEPTQEVDDEPLLSTYTEQELAEREQAQQQAEEADASQQREQAQRAQADAEADNFTLSGSNRTADVAAARGQSDLLGAQQNIEKPVIYSASEIADQIADRLIADKGAGDSRIGDQEIKAIVDNFFATTQSSGFLMRLPASRDRRANAGAYQQQRENYQAVTRQQVIDRLKEKRAQAPNEITENTQPSEQQYYRDWPLLDEMPDGWKRDPTAGSPLARYEFATNGRSVLSGQQERALVRIRPAPAVGQNTDSPTAQVQQDLADEPPTPKRRNKPLQYTGYSGEERSVRSYQEVGSFRIAKVNDNLYEVINSDGQAVSQMAGPGGAIEAAQRLSNAEQLDTAPSEASEPDAPQSERITWQRRAKNSKVWKGSNGMVIADQGFSTGGTRMPMFMVFADQSAFDAGVNLATFGTLSEAKKAAPGLETDAPAQEAGTNEPASESADQGDQDAAPASQGNTETASLLSDIERTKDLSGSAQRQSSHEANTLKIAEALDAATATNVASDRFLRDIESQWPEVRAQAVARAREELGIRPDEGRTTEAAMRQAIEQAVVENPNADSDTIHQAMQEAASADSYLSALSKAGLSMDAASEMIRDVRNQAMLERARNNPVPITPEMIGYDFAETASRGVHMRPDRVARYTVDGHVSHLLGVYDSMARYAKTEAQKQILNDEFTRYRDGYLQRVKTTLERKGRTMSPMVTGPANFPAERNRKRMESERKAIDDLQAFDERAQKVMRKKLRNAKEDGTQATELEQARQRLQAAEEAQERMKDANKIIRSGKDVERRLVEEAGLTERQARDVLEPDYMGKTGFASFQLRNNNAAIRQARQRVAELEQLALNEQEAKTGSLATEYEFEGGRMELAIEDQRVRLVFDGVPSDEMRNRLKSRGFRWSPKNKAWQRKLTANGIAVAGDIVGIDGRAINRDLQSDPRYALGGSDTAAVQADDIRDALASSPELSDVTVIQSAAELPPQSILMMALQGVNPRDVRGLFVGDQLYVIADNVDDVQEGVRTAVHEAVGHQGMRAVLGEDLDRVMLNLYRNLPNSKEGRDALREVRRDYPFLDPENRKDRITIAEEMVAHLLEKGHRPKAWQRAVAKIRELLRQLFPSVAWTYTDALALGEQSREYLRKQQAENQSGDDQRYALRSKQRANFEDAFSDFTNADRAAAAKIGSRTPPQRAVAWFKEKADRAGLKIRQGMVDRYAALKEMDERLYGETALGENIQRSSWVLARMSNAANGALHAMLHNGRIKLNRQERIIEMQDGDAKGLGEVLGRLGSAAEIERFMGWIAGNRAARLAQDGRENLFDVGDINAMKSWNRGQTEDGRSRQQLYKEVFDEFQQYRDDVLAVAEQSGIITSEQREMWGEEFYVPFYRLAEDDQQVSGMMATSGLSRQQAYKRLKGGSQNLNDLLQNTMMNLHHLLDASLKNQAATQAIENAKKLGMAERVPESNRDTKRSTFVMENGQKAFYEIDDPLVFTALTALAHPGMNSMAMKVMRGFKRVFTNLTTTTPQFMVANLIRDSLQASATSDVSKNAFKNVIEGGRSYKDERIRAQMLASGASFNFGHLYGNNPDELRAQLTRNMRNAKLVNGPAMVPNVLRAGWSWWNDVNNATENLNRAAIYSQNRDKGALRAAFESRDLIDFSAHGAWPAVRVLIDIVPFLNARIQGLDKIYRSGVKPGASVLAEAFGKGKANVTDKQAAARFWTVTGVVTMATIALYLHNQDDEEYQKLEDWQKDTYWFFRAGNQAFFIPKPFEVGAMATLAERMTEQFVDDKATGKLFAQRLGHMMTDTFSFSPVPQMMQPALDIYANYDAFTGRPIEGVGMERLSPELRRRANTSKAAEWISGALNSTVGAIGDPDKNPLALSPVQVDHLIGGYFGQVGTWVASSADVAWRAATGVENPAQRWYEYQPVRRFYRNLGDEDRYTKYGTIFYEGLREANRAYSDAKELREMGRLADAAEVATNKRDMLALRLPLNRAQRRLNTINQQIDIIRRSNLDGEVKRQRIDRLNAVKNQIQRALGEQVQEARAR